MNKAITDGLVFTPPPFSAGLSNWSSGDGTVGSPSYQGSANAALVPADQDFGGCLELLKTATTQKLRAYFQTPMVPGCYLQVTVRIKAISGNFPDVRIAGWAGNASDANVPVPQTGPTVTLNTYGKVVTLKAIIGSGNRPGVNLVWGTVPLSGHFGIDLLGANGGTVRIDDIEIEDVTSVFQRVMMDWVDVRDYGAIGNGVAQDHLAFLAADAAAAGRTVLVSAGTYLLGDHVTFVSPVRFQGTVTMPANKRLILEQNLDLETYAKAFGNDLTGFERGVQALFNGSDHVTFDLNGRRLDIDRPIDMFAAVNGITSYTNRRTIRNGQIVATTSTNWNSAIVTSQATYSTLANGVLTGVTNAANILPGSLITGSGVGREIYVTSVNVGASTLTLSRPLVNAAGTQVFTFTRFRYMLDFSGFSRLDRMELNDIEFLCNGAASGIMLAPSGITFRLSDCVMNRPLNRGITSTGTGCQGMFIDRCQFLSNEQPLPANSRTTICFNVNANDVKIRENRAVKFRHFGILDGSGHLVASNHWFQGDDQIAGTRTAGLVLASTNIATTITGNYVDNSFIEWTNEHDPDPGFNSEFSFGGLSIVGNIFIAIDVATFFRWLVITPRGPGHYIQGLTVSGNSFRPFNATVDRVEAVDTTFATLDFSRFRNVVFHENNFNGVNQVTTSPIMIEHQQNTAATTWTVDAAPWMPFGARARSVQAIVAEGQINGPAAEVRSDMPWVRTEQGPTQQQVQLNWANTSRGTVQVTVRCDKQI